MTFERVLIKEGCTLYSRSQLDLRYFLTYTTFMSVFSDGGVTHKSSTLVLYNNYTVL